MFKEFTALQIVCLLPFSVVFYLLPKPFDALIYLDISFKIYVMFSSYRQHRGIINRRRQELDRISAELLADRERLEQLLKEIRQAPAFTSNPN